jgi:hypothetical protein
MRSFRDKAQFLAVVGLCHITTTVIINFLAASWYLSKYEHSAMQGREVHLPWMLIILEYAGKVFMLPIVPLVYAWEATSHVPIGFAVIANSSLTALLVLFTRTEIQARRATRKASRRYSIT